MLVLCSVVLGGLLTNAANTNDEVQAIAADDKKGLNGRRLKAKPKSSKRPKKNIFNTELTEGSRSSEKKQNESVCPWSKFQQPDMSIDLSEPEAIYPNVLSEFIALSQDDYFGFTSCASKPQEVVDMEGDFVGERFDRLDAGACSTEYLCSYMNEFTCNVYQGVFSPDDSCEDIGFTRLLEVVGTTDDDDLSMKVCIRNSDAFEDPNKCNNMESSSIGAYGEYCIGNGKQNELTSNDCASLGYTKHINVPDSNLIDASICVKELRVSRSLSLSCAPVRPSVVPCDEVCQINNAARQAVLAGIGKIPKVGPGLSAVVGFIFLTFTTPIENILTKLVEYFEEQINVAIDMVLLDNVLAQWRQLGTNLQRLQLLIETGDTSEQAVRERTNKLGLLIDRCGEL